MTFLDWVLILAVIFVLMGLFMAWEASRLRRLEKMHETVVHSQDIWLAGLKEKEDWIKEWTKKPGAGED